MPEAREVVAQPVGGTAEGEQIPWDRRALELSRLQALVVDAQLPANRRSRVDDDDRCATGVGVDVDESIEADVEAAFFSRFADGRRGQRFAAIDIAARKHPFAISRLDRPPYEGEPAGCGRDDGADRDLRIQIEDEPTLRADGTLGLARFEQPSLEGAAAARTELVRVRVVVRVQEVHSRQYNSPVMSILKVARMGHPVLRAKARPLEKADLTGAAVQKLIDDMIDTMVEYHGVGLAAPQVHEGLRIFVASLDVEDDEKRDSDPEPIALINPEITVVGSDVVEDWEGCLSIPDVRGRVPRSREIKLRALDRHGERIQLSAHDFPARVIQHETDHLDGVLFFDRMRSFESLTFLDEYARYWAKD
jgi:peptide deformylase